METQAQNSLKNMHQVGYTVLRAGTGSEMHACLVSPYVGDIKKAAVSEDGVTLSLATCDVALTGIPKDVSALLAIAPERVLIVSVDTLASVRQSGTIAELSSTVH